MDDVAARRVSPADAELEIEARAAEGSFAFARFARRSVSWLIGGAILYLLAPSVLGVLGSAHRLVEIHWYWLIAVLLAQGAVLLCTWELQRLLIHAGPRTRDSFVVIACSQLVGSAVATAAPVGGAAGTAVQVRTLARRGTDARRAASGLVAFSLLQVASVGALALVGPFMVVVGMGVPATLARTALYGCGALAVITAVLVVALRTDGVVDRIGPLAARIARRDPKRLTVTLRRERRHLRHALAGPGSWKIMLVALARSVADFLCLFFAVAAVTSWPSPPMVLLAFVAAAVLKMFPFTPGGLGPVEAALITLLTAAVTTRSGAVLATLAYRIVSMWLPLLLAVPAAWWLRRHPGVVPVRRVPRVVETTAA